MDGQSSSVRTLVRRVPVGVASDNPLEVLFSAVLVGEGLRLSTETALFGDGTSRLVAERSTLGVGKRRLCVATGGTGSGKFLERSTLGEGNLRLAAGAGDTDVVHEDLYLDVTSLLRGFRRADPAIAFSPFACFV